MGWSPKSNIMLKYQHYYSDDSIDAMLLADGLVLSAETAISPWGKKGLLKPIQCPNCDNETN